MEAGHTLLIPHEGGGEAASSNQVPLVLDLSDTESVSTMNVHQRSNEAVQDVEGFRAG